MGWGRPGDALCLWCCVNSVGPRSRQTLRAQTVRQPDNQTDSQSARQSVRQPDSQAVRQPNSQANSLAVSPGCVTATRSPPWPARAPRSGRSSSPCPRRSTSGSAQAHSASTPSRLSSVTSLSRGFSNSLSSAATAKILSGEPCATITWDNRSGPALASVFCKPTFILISVAGPHL